ncbi:hypothetical protein [Niabella beijingensis]|uniref:hypothetical protein n=1 Tax=Niabella beijingensis TaxID=2872700 RepID=UPI001CBCA71D|nr:hypothetical protein [Niabella beijingensis]MBZ4189744.1 hypothetical protein [Niabella beijingensis]
MNAVKKASAKKSIRKSATAPVAAAATTETVVAKKANEPTLLPPGAGGLTAWNNNVKVVGTWGIAENNNAWLNISGMGFRKIKENNTQALLAILMIGAHARDKNSVVNVRTEADNKVYELYAW